VKPIDKLTRSDFFPDIIIAVLGFVAVISEVSYSRRQLLAKAAMAASRVTQLRQNRQNQLLFEVPL
jgi:hypothetical protein